MAAKHGGYNSTADLCGTRETPALIPALSTVTKAEYDSVSDYACTLKVENAELKPGGGDYLTTISTLEAASAATKTITGLLTEMRAVHTAQMREMTALIAAATAINAPAPPCKEEKTQAQIHINPVGTRRVCYPPPC